jgi:hypothetical protein
MFKADNKERGGAGRGGETDVPFAGAASPAQIATPRLALRNAVRMNWRSSLGAALPETRPSFRPNAPVNKKVQGVARTYQITRTSSATLRYAFLGCSSLCIGISRNSWLLAVQFADHERLVHLSVSFDCSSGRRSVRENCGGLRPPHSIFTGAELSCRRSRCRRRRREAAVVGAI